MINSSGNDDLSQVTINDEPEFPDIHRYKSYCVPEAYVPVT